MASATLRLRYWLPTGTISFMMDCDTTGIEPDIALVKYKQLAGGGSMKIVNRSVPHGLHKLGYDEPQIRPTSSVILKSTTRSKAHLICRRSICRSSTVRSSRPTACEVSAGRPT